MSAQWLPPAKQTFVDAQGRPLVGGLVYHYEPGTDTFKDTWQDPAQAALNTNPVVLDGRGQAPIWGVGYYRQRVTDAAGNGIWDRVTTITAQNGLVTYDTMADAHTAQISNTVQAVFLLGYYAAGDLGGALYKRVNAEPTHAGKFQSADGAWWEFADPEPSTKQFGVKNDWNGAAGTDNTFRLQAFIDYVQQIAKTGIVSAGSAMFNGTLRLAWNLPCILRGESQEPHGSGGLDGFGSALINANTLGANAIECINLGAPGSDYAISLSDFTVLGNAASGDGIHLRNVHRFRCNRMWISTHGGTGIYTYDCWGYEQYDTIITHCSKFGLYLGRRANANIIEGGGAQANASIDGYSNLACSGEVGFESLGSKVINFDCSYAGTPATAVATPNFLMQYCWGWEVQIYSENGPPGLTNVYVGIGTRNLRLSGLFLNNNILVEELGAQGFHCNIFMWSESENVTFTGSGTNDVPAKVWITKLETSGFTVTINTPTAWLQGPGIVAPSQADPGPVSPTTGQLYFSSTRARLRFFDGAAYQTVPSYPGNPPFVGGSRSLATVDVLTDLLTGLAAIGAIQNATTP